MSALEILEKFTIDELPDLDLVVMGALEMLESTRLPETSVPFRRPLIIGSGNAESTGRILFNHNDAVFANESNFETLFKKIPDIDGVVLVSAGGGKHAVEIADKLQQFNLPSVLFTNNPEAKAIEYFAEENVRVFPRNREPYTYNTSTYLSMIIADTGEKAHAIKRFINLEMPEVGEVNLGAFNSFVFILPPQLADLKDMLRTKFDELFGSNVVGRFFTPEEIKHAKTVVPNNDELFVSVGVNNEDWGDENHRVNLALPEWYGYACGLAVTYHFVGMIQKSHPPYFKDNIVEYCKKASEVFGQNIEPIVE